MTEPKIRFPEYKDEWVEYPLEGILVENLDPIPTPREGYRRVGIYCHAKGTFQEDVPADKVLDVDTMYKIHKDNLIVNITFAWEHAIAIVKPEDEGMLVSHRFPEYEFNKGHIPLFYKYLILRPYMKNQLSLASPGGAGRNRVLNKKQFMQIPVYVPCEAEQQKIADFLSNVDEVIVASEEEVTNLEQQKKAVMQKIFSQEVRFKKEDGSDFPDWDEKKLEDVVEFLDGKRKPIEAGEREAGIYPYYGASGIVDYVKDYIFDDDLILLSEDGANIIDRNSRVCFMARGKYWVNNHAHVLKAIKGNVNEFICEQLESFDYSSYNTGSAQPKINQKVCRNLRLNIPHPDEQQLIADFLTSYDEAITAAKQELAKWKELKKGLLQQMFV